MNQNENIPYIVYEAETARSERHVKRLWIALIITIILIFTSNAIWVWYISQYDFENYDYSQDGEGVNIIGDENGVDYNGSKVESAETDIEKS